MSEVENVVPFVSKADSIIVDWIQEVAETLTDIEGTDASFAKGRYEQILDALEALERERNNSKLIGEQNG